MADDDYDYVGPATVTVAGRAVTVELMLRGHFQGIDGIYRWYGRIRPNRELAAMVGTGAQGTVETEFASVPAVFGDLDFWDRYRISGRSTPPFLVPRSLAELAGPAPPG
ncbi:DUF4873 domain-containing protein [Nocardia brasiliensis]|uniref:DUF4873 domain-containing protein n=1 Tax=Nocardia brasiliensis TaxID=37326 RepID=A0A6G9XMG1_NOCBR|nr:DUF4873 domain-containing protein [Nocardia brasiliensis]QIS02053.1 DUF4873 domain-containing protein [Nocardia brasiliensis]